jgi:hypothetical protein
MKARFEKRRFDKSIKVMAQSLVSEVMFNEYTDMIADGRERTPERLAWLKEIGPQQALNKFDYGKTLPKTTTDKFMKFANRTANEYIDYVVNKMEKQLDEAKEKAESGA